MRITPPLPYKLLELDYKICQKLITTVFDPEKGIDSCVVDKLEAVELENGKKLSLRARLDLLLLYLRRVHFYCLYCGEEYEDERMLSTRCGPQHIRHYQSIPDEEFDEIFDKSVKDSEAVSVEVEAKGESSELTIEQIAGLKTSQNLKWQGSIIFMQKYTDMALKRIK